MDLKINNRLVAYRGCIGRREYFLNVMYLCIITSFMTLPFVYYSYTHVSNPLEIWNVRQLFVNMPLFASFFWVLACLFGIACGFGLILRRLADITGTPSGLKDYILAAVMCALPYFSVFKFSPMSVLFLLINFVFGIVLLSFPGKITGMLPPDSVKRFNWGAFWGTWIWGVFNKTYVTLWAIPLFFTPAFLYWSLICGVKGNEWAFKNTKALDAQAFHKKQKVQAIVWNCLAGILIFILPIFLVFLITAVIAVSAVKNPEGLDNVLNKAESMVTSYIENSFENYELDIDENRFYMKPQEWVGLTYEERYNLFKGAASVASFEKMRSNDSKFEGYCGSKSTEMAITTIYSTYNGEVLAAFNMDVNELTDFKSVFKAALNAVYFNTNPELPPMLPKND